MTFEEFIEKVEQAFSFEGHLANHWTIKSPSFVKGMLISEMCRTFIIHSPISSGGGPFWYLHFHKDTSWTSVCEFLIRLKELHPHGMDWND